MSSEHAHDPALRVRAVSKRFPRNAQPLERLLVALFDRHRHDGESHWAVRDVSFDLQRGETIGVMGRNGSGKSTLLEIIAGTLTPTSGRVEVRGKLAALLELGAAFTPELTGRENVFVYGSLLGMSNAVIHERFDEIVAFAELEAFIDEPVKTYSSGMFVRLAFATAISATPEILVIDEALAVGDEAFQRRCYARIESLKQSGTSILFVSHAAGTVLELCDRALLLDRGEPLMLGEPRDVVRHYHRLIYAAPEDQEAARDAILEGHAFDDGERDAIDPASSPVEQQSNRVGDSPTGGGTRCEPLEAGGFEETLTSKSRLEYASRGARISEASIRTAEDRLVNVLHRGELYFVCFRIDFDEVAFRVRAGMLVKSVVGTDLGGVVSAAPSEGIERVASGTTMLVRLPFRARLVPDTYFANVGVVGLADEGETYLHRITDALAFRVLRERETIITGSIDLSSTEPCQLDVDPD